MEAEKEKTKNKMVDVNVLIHQSLYTAQKKAPYCTTADQA